MNPCLFISWRYLITKREQKFLKFMSWISILGVGIGVMTLIVVISVMTGFDEDLKDKIVGNISHIQIESFEPFSDYQSIISKLKEIKEIKASSPYITGQVFLNFKDRFFPIALRGVNPEEEKKITKLKDYLIEGDLDLKKNEIVIGKELSNNLGLDLDDELSIFSPFLSTSKSLKIKGIFYSGMYDYDLNLAYVNLETSQEIFGLSGRITGIGIKLTDLFLASPVKRKIQQFLRGSFIISIWTEKHRSFFAALKLEKITMFIILTLIILVASFNIISTLQVMVVNKTKDVGILRALGLTRKNITSIFIFKGLFTGTLGITLGSILGVFLCKTLKNYQFIKLPKDIYYLDRLPVVIRFWPDISLIILVSLFITLTSTIYPARRAANLNITEALRYE